ncbi:Alpha/Beta hydrolase protein [Jackrogersella minutella]|nr:Alpha/Beta hydrolase protein [Jackrogersella minutella]
MSLARHIPGYRRATTVVLQGLVTPPHATTISEACPSSSLANSNSNPISSTSSSTSLSHTRNFTSQSIPLYSCKMSTMPAQHGHSEACCNIPPVVAKGYSAKGGYEELGGYKSYVTGPQEATKGIITIFDIFGFFPQTLQGADILSTSDHSQKYKVFIPDWFNGEPCPISIFPPDTEEKQKTLGAFFQKNSPPSVAAKVPDYVKAVAAKHPEITSWTIIGFCWGGKVVSLVTSKADTIFKAGVEIHPAMVDPSDAAGIKVPLALLASKDEPPEDVKKFEAALTGPKLVETFADQIHGWMAARSDLEDEHVKAEYIRGYETVLKFLSQHA